MKSHFSKNAINLIQGLTTKNVKERIGCKAEGIKELAKHPFFEGIDWEKLSKK